MSAFRSCRQYKRVRKYVYVFCFAESASSLTPSRWNNTDWKHHKADIEVTAFNLNCLQKHTGTYMYAIRLLKVSRYCAHHHPSVTSGKCNHKTSNAYKEDRPNPLPHTSPAPCLLCCLICLLKAPAEGWWLCCQSQVCDALS
jgi:hypothetical protein